MSILFCPVKAQTSVFSVGVRGGGQMCLPAGMDIHDQLGATGTLDMRYTFYGDVSNTIGIGFALGAGIGYGTTGFKGTNIDRYSNTDYLNNQLDYTVTSSFRQQDRFAKAEASLMVAFCFGNVTLHIGPRFMLPFASRASLTIEEASIDAYYPLYNVHVTDKPITGFMATPYRQAVPSHVPKYNVLLAAEIGYEWALDDCNSLGLQAYAEVGVWNNYTATAATGPLIQVMPITDAANPVPAIRINNTDGRINGCRFLDFGIRVYYAFSTGKASDKYHYNYHRDTRNHRNRYYRQ